MTMASDIMAEWEKRLPGIEREFRRKQEKEFDKEMKRREKAEKEMMKEEEKEKAEIEKVLTRENEKYRKNDVRCKQKKCMHTVRLFYFFGGFQSLCENSKPHVQ